MPDTDPNAVTQPITPQRRIDDPFIQALSEAPWEVRLAYYAARDFWNWLTGILAILSGVLPTVLLYLNDNPESMQKFEAMLPPTWRWGIALTLAFATVTTSIISIVKKGKS